MFPAITSAVKSFLARREEMARPISLELKGLSGGVFFDMVDTGWYGRTGSSALYSMFAGGAISWSGEAVSVATALNHSVVWACNRLISESIGMIPAVMLQKKNGVKRVCDGLDGNPSHPMYSALHDAPNDEISAMGFSETLTSHCLLQGNAYAQIIRRSGTGTAIELQGLRPEQVYPDRERYGQKRLVYVVKDSTAPDKTYTVEPGKPHDILHIRGLGWDGIRGYSVIMMGRQSMGTAMAAERNVARFYANGGRLPYVLTMEGRFKLDSDFAKFRADWEQTYAEPHKAPILEPPIKEYKTIGVNAKDAQLLETRLFDIHEICRWFLVSPHLVGDLSRATFSNIEQLALEFVKMTLSTWITRWEQDLWRCVLTPEEKSQGFYWKHNINSLLRGDFQSRMAGYSAMLQNGIASINEVRDLEDWNSIEGGDDHWIQLNMQDVNKPSAARVPVNQKPQAADLPAAEE